MNVLPIHCVPNIQHWSDTPHGTEVYYLIHIISSLAQTMQSVTPHYMDSISVSITTVATSVMSRPAMLLLMLFSSVNVWEVFFLKSLQRRSVALKANSVNGLATMCYCHLKINLEYVAIPM